MSKISIVPNYCPICKEKDLLEGKSYNLSDGTEIMQWVCVDCYHEFWM